MCFESVKQNSNRTLIQSAIETKPGHAQERKNVNDPWAHDTNRTTILELHDQLASDDIVDWTNILLRLRKCKVAIRRTTRTVPKSVNQTCVCTDCLHYIHPTVNTQISHTNIRSLC